MSALGLFSDINNLPIAPYKPTDLGEVIQSSLYGTSQRTEFGIVPTLETEQDFSDREVKLKERFTEEQLKQINTDENKPEIGLYKEFNPNRNPLRNDKIDAAILEGRKIDPARWNDIKTTDEIQEQKKDRARAAINSAAEISSKATTFDSIAGGLIGGLGGAFTDPINIATLPFGATSGMGILKAMKAEALLNAGVEAVEAPFVSKWQKELGFKYGIGDSAIDIATAGAGGAAFAGIVRGARPALEALGRGINKTTQYTKERSLPILQKIADSEILPTKIKDAAKYMSRVAHIDEEIPNRQAINGEIKTSIDPQEIAQHRQVLQDTQDSFDNYREPIYDKQVVGNVKDYSDAELFDQYKAVSAELNQLPNPKGLLQFLKETGGIKDEAGELANYGITTKSYPGLLQKEGQNNSIDYARERAVEAGYLPEETTTSDFLEAIREDYVNRNVFSEDGQTISFKRSNLEDGLRQLDEHFGNKGINLRDEATAKRLALQAKLEKQQAGLRQRAEPIAKDELSRIENEINQAGFDKETSKLYSQAFRSFYETQLARGNMESKKVLDDAFAKLKVQKSEPNKRGKGRVYNQKEFTDAERLPFEEGVPSKEKVNQLNSWLKKNSDKYNPKYVIMYHGTGKGIPVEKEGLKPTSKNRRKSYQSASGYVYLANTPKRAESFGDMGNQSRSSVYAVRVPIKDLKADIDQLNNLRSVGEDLGNSVAESIVYGGGARIKGKINPYDIKEIDPNNPNILFQSQPTFYSQLEKQLTDLPQAKGSIEFNAPDGKTIISLFEGKDLSTLLHETGHFFLETQKLLVNVANAPDDLKADWQTTLDWLGSKDGNFTREQHEEFARGFEAYLREGNAPSPALIGVFERFKQWLTNIYKDFKELGVNVSDEMRGVFDRMLATDEQIERVSMFDGPEQDLVFRPNDALASMERDVADLESLGDDVYNADFERLLKEQPDLEIDTPDGRMTIREIADQIKEDDNVLSAIKTCAIGK